jgi:uncharacterized protein YjiS (DUF1127 family)
MTTLDLYPSDAEAGVPAKRPSIFAGIGRLLAELRTRRRHRETVIELSRLDAHLLRDIGIEPMDVTDVLNNRRLSLTFNPMRPRRADHE